MQLGLDNATRACLRYSTQATPVEELRRLSHLYETASATFTLQKASLREYEELLSDANEDLARNKTAAKLRDLGAQHSVKLASDHCPTCHQPVEDSLLLNDVTGPQMGLATNISYLESQCRMLDRQITGIHAANLQLESSIVALESQIAAKQDYLHALRGDVSSGTIESRSIIRRQLQIETEVKKLQHLEDVTAKLLTSLVAVSTRLSANQLARKSLPKDMYSIEDTAKMSLFQKMFRANAGSFGYESAPIAEIEINQETHLPFLSQLELREIITKTSSQPTTSSQPADVKHHSSASDFVRLIWSYLLALYQTSSHITCSGNHPGILLLDEPGQHSMAVDSQHALLRQLSSESSLQSIVAASFDEAESVFNQATEGVPHKIIQWEGKLIRPL